jgi:hypothetical protein
MATFAAGKASLVNQYESEINKFFSDIGGCLKAPPEIQKGEEEPLEIAFTKQCAEMLRRVIDAIPFPAHCERNESLAQSKYVRGALMDTTLCIDPRYAFCMSVVFVSARELSKHEKMTNPTWQREAEEKVGFPVEDLDEVLNRNAQNMILDLQAFYGSEQNDGPFSTIASDARKMPIRTATVDKIITSPPYLTRIDYAVSTSLELAAFGGKDFLKYVRHQTMGAPVITKNEKFQKKEWGNLCNEVLDRIKGHSTKAAATYYWKNIVQYFIDADNAIDEILRVLSNGGEGLIVVQSSYFKDVEIPLGDIYVQMLQAKGVLAEIAFREEVKGHMAHVNTKSRAYKEKKVYYEDFVYFKK